MPFDSVFSPTNALTGAACTCTNPSLGKTAINNNDVYRVSALTHMVEDSHNLKIASTSNVPASNHAWLSRWPFTQTSLSPISSYVLSVSRGPRFIQTWVFTFLWAHFCYWCWMITVLAKGRLISAHYILRQEKLNLHVKLLSLQSASLLFVLLKCKKKL